jgi:hypothetical protein
MYLITYILFSTLIFNPLNDIPKDRNTFISPLRIAPFLSSNFGELRVDHFHSGLDIKTQGVTGKEVVAAADGFIYRISVSPGGFGRALYIRHPSGYSTVYGHLERFSPEIEKFVKERQYTRKSFTVTLLPEKEEFPVKQGELIAYSGNSGASGGPHLHFEIRKSESEKPVNPLLFDFGIEDNIKPVFEKLAIYPITSHTLVNNKNAVKKINVTGDHGSYSITNGNEITISGPAGFGIKAYDQMNGIPNRFAVYSIELSIDSLSVYNYIMNAFSFDESRYVNSHIDYEYYMKENSYIERTYVLPGDKLSVYKSSNNRGIFNFNDDKIHHVQFIVRDVNGNKSTLSFNIKALSAEGQSTVTAIDSNRIVMPYGTSNKFSADNVSLNIPAGALYDTLYFTYKKEKGTLQMLSDLHYIDDKFTPIHKACTLSIKPTSIPSGKEPKMLIIKLDDDERKYATNSIWVNGNLSSEILSFGRYYIGIDTVAPIIAANGLVPGANLTERKEIRIKITDDLSGIKSYEPEIDGEWALFEYDQKYDLLTYTFDETKIKKATKHNLSLKVTDKKDNISYFKCDFIW